MASAATARAQIVPFRPKWQWPKPFQPKNKPPKVWEHWEAKPDSLETEFDRECRRLKLEGAPLNRLISSMSLRYWAKLNAKKRYVPTELLAAWGITVNFDTEMPW